MSTPHPFKASLPPLAALRAFEAVARLASFKAAAAELFVTPTAVSHQIRQLEEHLGLRLLDRTPRAVKLTPDGRLLYEAAASGFAEIAHAVSRLKRGRAHATLTLSATTAFLSHWLVPLLADLRRLLPNLDLRLHGADAIVELRDGSIDAAIRYGKGPFAGVEATPLKSDAFAPLCSPRLKLKNIKDLHQAALIHIDGRVVPRALPDWPRWCAEAGVTDVNTRAGVRFSDSMHAVQAAIAGQGVAIVSLVLVSDALASGLLVQPFETVLPGETYHFVSARGPGERPELTALRTWFQQQLR
jgi:LysR family glycine cleavage system transcriptional activator